jgi:hypothetical protein
VLDALIERHTWADDYSAGGIEGWTVAVIEGRSAEEVVRIYGGDPDHSVGDYTFAESYDLQGEPVPSTGGCTVDSGLSFHLQLLMHGNAVIALENNGYSGTLPEIARRCSADGAQFFAIYWSMTSNPRITQAIDGRVTAYVETFAGDKPYVGEPAPPWLTGISIELDHLRATAMALMEQQTGLAFDREWLNEKRPTYRIPDPDVMLRDVAEAREV